MIARVASRMLDTKVVALVMLGYMVLSFTLPIRREIYDWGTANPEHPISMVFQIHIWLPILVLLGFMALEAIARGWPYTLWQSLSSSRMVLPAAYTALLVCLALTLYGIPGLWWTWLTVGIHIAGCTLLYNKLRIKLTAGMALITALGVICIAAFLWECAYQTMFYFKYYSDEFAIGALLKQYRFLSPLLIAGLFPFAAYGRNIIGSFRFSRWAIVPAALFMGAWLVWFALGFWVDVMYDFEGEQWVQNGPDNFQMAIYRSSKVWLNLIPVVLLKGGV